MFSLILSDLKRVIPICFVAGVSMELFMINTGFYNIACRKEAERRYARRKEYERMENRAKELRLR